MRRQRTYSIEFKRQVALEFLCGHRGLCITEGQQRGLEVLAEPPGGSEQVVSQLESTVIEALDAAPFLMSRVVEDGDAEPGQAVASRHDDAKGFAVNVVLLPRHVHGVVIFEVATDDHSERGSPGWWLEQVGRAAEEVEPKVSMRMRPSDSALGER